MALVSFRWRRILRSSIATVLGCGAIGVVGTMGLSALLTWDPSGDPLTPGGTGTWDYLTATQWDDQGTLPNVAWTDTTGKDTGVFKGTGNLVHLGAPITANGLRFDTTGYTIDNNGVPANTLTLVNATSTVAPIIQANAANVTSIISANIGGNDGLQLTAAAFAGTTTTLSGDNKIVGGVTITSGTVRLGSAGALNQTIANALTFGTTAASQLLLRGNNLTIRDLTGTSALSGIVNGLGATNAILTVYQTNDQLVRTKLDNNAGTLELVKAGPATLTLASDSTYTFPTTVRGAPLAGVQTGTLELAGSAAGDTGRLTQTNTINLSDGGTLRLSNNSSFNQTNRIPDLTPINFRGGTLAFVNPGTGGPYSETGGAVNVLIGSNTIQADKAASGQTSTLSLGTLTRSQGAVLNFQSNFAGSPTPGQIGIDNRDRIVITPTPALNDGILGGWALYDGVDFATYNTTTVTSVKIATYSVDPFPEASWTTATNIKIALPGNVQLSDSPTTPGFRVVNSLNLVTEPLTLDVFSLTLTVDTGGVISQSSSLTGQSIDNGKLTAGTAAGADLILHVVNPLGALTVNANIVDNGPTQANATGLVKSGPGLLILTQPNTYTGPTAVIGGTLQVSNDNQLGGGAAITPLRLYSGTLSVIPVSSTFALNARHALEIGGNSFISIPAGSSVATAKTLTYAGGITSLTGVGIEGSLTFLSNSAEGSSDLVEPGKVTAGLTSAIALTGSLRIDATTAAATPTAGVFSAASTANTIGRSFQLGTNGTAYYLQRGGTLSIGAGLDDTFDIGVKDETTISPAAKVGTFQLSQVGVGTVSQFTVKVDKVRIGVQTQETESPTTTNNTAGTLTLGTNNDITAGTSFTISDNANASGSTLTASSVTFGAGVNNITTQTLLIGGRKGNATFTLPASGTLSLRGFGDRTLNMSIGRSDTADVTGASTGTLNASSGAAFSGSFDAIVVGEKTGSNLAGGATGTLTLSTTANTVVANSLTLGMHKDYGGANSASALGIGTLNMGAGTFNVYGDIALGTHADNGAAKGVLNLTGGTLSVGGNITKTNSDRSEGNITVNGGTLTMRNALVGDSTSGNITASQLAYRAGSITQVGTVTLDGRSVTSGSVVGSYTDALLMRDVSLPGALVLSGILANAGGIHYEAAGGGAGGTLASVSLGTVARTFNVEDNAAAAADLTITGAVTGAFLTTKTGAGTLLFNSTVAGSVTATVGAVGGNGNIAGTLTLGAGTTATPGGSGNIGTLTANLANFAANSTYAVDINSTTQSADKLSVATVLSIGISNSTILTFTDLDSSAPFAFFTVPILDYNTRNGAFFTVGGQVIDDYDPANPSVSTKFQIAGRSYALDYDANGGHTIALVSVPEPGSLALLAGGVALLGGVRRRRAHGRCAGQVVS